MTGAPDVLLVWRRILGEYATGVLDAQDVWDAVDEFALGRMPDPSRLPAHPPDLAGPDEVGVVQEQALLLDDLIGRFVGGALSPDDLASQALDVLGLAERDADEAPTDITPPPPE